MRILLSPTDDSKLLDSVVGILESACVRYPDTFYKDSFYSYATNKRALVVLFKEPHSLFYRLTIPQDVEHVVFQELTEQIKQGF